MGGVVEKFNHLSFEIPASALRKVMVLVISFRGLTCYTELTADRKPFGSCQFLGIVCDKYIRGTDRLNKILEFSGADAFRFIR